MTGGNLFDEGVGRRSGQRIMLNADLVQLTGTGGVTVALKHCLGDLGTKKGATEVVTVVRAVGTSGTTTCLIKARSSASRDFRTDVSRKSQKDLTPPQ